MKTILSYLLLHLLVVISSVAINAEEPNTTNLRQPMLSMEEALSVAKEFVKVQQIKVSDSYIDSASLDLNPRGDRGKFWLITWQRKQYTKGGQTFVRVYMNSSTEVSYGE